MGPTDILPLIDTLAPIVIGVVALGVGGWLIDTRMRIKNGYPLNGSWGQKLYPKVTTDEAERIKLLSQENAQLRAELGSVKDRLATVERIVTDGGYALTHQIEALRELQKN
ncbi:MAG: hypothetical protein JSR96_01220 [Proteobacteria bacterium]|nr:hypothetical protein [Pseudomonadota bacterium]